MSIKLLVCDLFYPVVFINPIGNIKMLYKYYFGWADKNPRLKLKCYLRKIVKLLFFCNTFYLDETLVLFNLNDSTNELF